MLYTEITGDFGDTGFPNFFRGIDGTHVPIIGSSLYPPIRDQNPKPERAVSP